MLLNALGNRIKLRGKISEIKPKKINIIDCYSINDEQVLLD